jgi:hypothetical protein
MVALTDSQTPDGLGVIEELLKILSANRLE